MEDGHCSEIKEDWGLDVDIQGLVTAKGGVILWSESLIMTLFH